MPLNYLRNLDKQLFKQLKEASTNPNPKNFLIAFSRFFLITLVGFLTLTFIATIAFWFIIDPLFGKLGHNPFNRFKCYGNLFQNKDAAWMKQRMAALEKIALSTMDEKFWQNNEQQYTAPLTNYQGVLNFQHAKTVQLSEENWEELERKYIYSFTICPIKTETKFCFKIANKFDKPGTKYLGDSAVNFWFDRDEIIDTMEIDAFSIADADNYIYTGVVTTNKNEYPILVYPSRTTGDLYYTVEELLNKPNNRISFVEDLENGIRFKVEPLSPILSDDPVTDDEMPQIYFLDIHIQDDGSLYYSITIDPSQAPIEEEDEELTREVE